MDDKWKVFQAQMEETVRAMIEEDRADINRQAFTLPPDYKRPWFVRRWLNRTGFHFRKPWGWDE